MTNDKTGPLQISDDLQRLAAEATATCAQLAYKAAVRLAEVDGRAAAALYEAATRGDRVMIAVDVDSPDGLTRLITVGGDQRITQHVAFGLFAPTTIRN